MKKTTIGYSIALLTYLVLGYPIGGHAESITSLQVESHFKSVKMLDGDHVTVKGRWERTNGNVTLHKPPRINTVSITCDKATMTCKEIIAELITPQEGAVFNRPQLYIDENTYKIIDWKGETICAKYSALVADFELRISVRDSLVERSWRETKAQGVTKPNPDNFENWILE